MRHGRSTGGGQHGDERRDAEVERESAVTEERQIARPSVARPETDYATLLHDLREATPGFTDSIAVRVQAEVRPYSGPVDGKRNRLIRMATDAGLALFFDLAAGREHASRRVDDLFAKMGHGEALDGHDLGPMMGALDLSAQMAWDVVRAFAVQHNASAASLDRLGDTIEAVVVRLKEQARRGHETAMRQLARDPRRLRHELAEAVLAGRDPHAAALAAGWTVPASVVVIAVQTGAEDPAEAPAWQDSPNLLVRPAGPDEAGPTAVVATDALPDALDLLVRDLGVIRVAASWPVPLEEAAAAQVWALRALDLAARGVIAADRVVECVDHRTQLWLHAEPHLRQQLCQELLGPLLAETPNSREILSETLLTWLETRDSAPAIAGRLDVHPQTIRYRWKRINELFGEALHDPEFVVQMTMLLKASVPLWKAGDQSDFVRFLTEEAG
jgi:hypothetical protein